jgi:hypothetical protein
MANTENPQLRRTSTAMGAVLTAAALMLAPASIAVSPTGIAAASPGVGAAGAEREADFVIRATQAGIPMPELTGPPEPQYAHLTPEERRVGALVLQGYLACNIAQGGIPGAAPNPVMFPIAQQTLCPEVVAPVVAAPAPAAPGMDPGTQDLIDWNNEQNLAAIEENRQDYDEPFDTDWDEDGINNNNDYTPDG